MGVILESRHWSKDIKRLHALWYVCTGRAIMNLYLFSGFPSTDCTKIPFAKIIWGYGLQGKVQCSIFFLLRQLEIRAGSAWLLFTKIKYFISNSPLKTGWDNKVRKSFSPLLSQHKPNMNLKTLLRNVSIVPFLKALTLLLSSVC